MFGKKYALDSCCFQKVIKESLYAVKTKLNLSIFKETSYCSWMRFSQKAKKADNSNIVNEDENKDEQEKSDLASELTKWAVQHNISHIAFSQLLITLAENGLKGLPKNSRVIFKAKENEIKVSSVPPGMYVHYGLEKNLQKLISCLTEKKVLDHTDINVSIFIDNLPLSKVTLHGLWTILGSVVGFNKTIFLIGAYSGYSKPKNSNLFLKDFVEEAKALCLTGLKISNIKYTLTIKRVICDAPAKAFILNVKNFVGYSSCTKCHVKGEYRNKKICFPNKSSPKLDQDFELNEVYKSERTKLLEIPNFGVVSNVPLEYLHLVCIGVLKKLVSMWVKNKKNYWVSENCDLRIEKNFANLNPFEFSAKPKPLCFFQKWTSSEFRQFLLYQGPVILKDALKKEYYDHFLSLHVACRILCMTESSEETINSAQEILHNFIKTLEGLYGKQHITHNVHGLYHLADDCRLHGTLDSFSAFPFENFLLKLRNSMRKYKKKSLPQMILRHSHENIFKNSLKKTASENFKVHKKLKVIQNDVQSELKHYTQYEKLGFKNKEIIPDKNGDKYVFLKNGKIVEVKSILATKEKSSNSFAIAGKEFLQISSFYTEPLDSSFLGVFKVRNVSETLDIWPVDMIKKKCMKIPTGIDECVIITLLEEDF